MNIPELNIGNLKLSIPVIQGGMGIGISLNSLASSVANCGGLGVLSGAQIGFKDPEFLKNPLKANLKALQHEISLAKSKASNGALGLNLMVAMDNYQLYVKEALKAKIDVIISGAGLPLDLPTLAAGSATKLIPIVSSAKAAHVICKYWDKKNKVAPDAFIVEGPLAGGHLGFSHDVLSKEPSLTELVTEVKKVAVEHGAHYGKPIPVIAAGGIYTGRDVRDMICAGADGVQMGTRFVTTHECDAHINFKEAYINATREQIGIVVSPVGMPGRAILNDFIQHPSGNKACFYKCLHKCGITDIPYCISAALINAANGNTKDALLFCGSNAYRATKLEHVADIFEEIKASFLD